MSEIRQYIKEMCGEMSHSCTGCEKYVEGKCSIKTDVVEAHGEDNYNEWVNEKPSENNACNYYKPQ